MYEYCYSNLDAIYAKGLLIIAGSRKLRIHRKKKDGGSSSFPGPFPFDPPPNQGKGPRNEVDGGCTFYHNTLRTKLSPLGI